MNLLNFTDSKRVGSILRCARTFRGYSLDQTAMAVGLPLGEIAAMEEGRVAVSLLQWRDFSRFLQLPMDSLKHGHLDLRTNAEITTGSIENGFILPQKYSDNKCIKVRELLPYFFYIQHRFGEQQLEHFFSTSGVAPEFFVRIDNQINLHFYDDLVPPYGRKDVAPEMLRIPGAKGHRNGSTTLRRVQKGSGSEIS